jgi:hypothetical protein
VPISLALVLVLLFINFGSARDMALAASVMPMALVGGVVTLLVSGTPLSISAAIGFVALLGISVMDGSSSSPRSTRQSTKDWNAPPPPPRRARTACARW